SDDSDDSEDYPLLSPAEQARILMREEPEDGDAKQTAIAPKTANEIPDEQFTKPDVTITQDMQITELGKVRHVVGNLILVAGFTSGEYQVLESGSILCSQDRTLIGAVNEPIGPVQGPLYSVGFPTAADIVDAGIKEGTIVYYVNQLSTYVFTEPLKAVKGTDASNVHDEEVLED
ncbi:NAF1-domain-containing protein, partial [Pseudovirgaria hyperparasitica]